MKVFTTAQIRELDLFTIEHEPISSLDLMERASKGFTEAFISEVPPSVKVYIFAGSGNNGGDALAIARMLHQAGYTVDCYLFNLTGKLSPDCLANRDRLTPLPLSFTEVTGEFNFPEVKKNEVVIDGLFGTGLTRPLSGFFAELIRSICLSPARIYSIDIPSGLYAEDNTHNSYEGVIKADKTFTFGSPKLAFLMPDTAMYAGEWTVLDIGFSREGIEKTQTLYYITTRDEMEGLVRPRNKFAYKNNFGHAMLMAGSRGKMGAAVLSAQACMRIGAGLLTCYLPGCGEQIMQTAFPEAMVEINPEYDFLSTPPSSLEPYQALGIGSGIGTHPITAQFLKDLLRRWKGSLVLDADALNIIAQDREMISMIPAGSILTPHVGEFDRLMPGSRSSLERLNKAQSLAGQLGCIIVLKGAYTAVCSPEGNIYFNTTGNPGMATAGSGDVLTGIITGLLAQGYTSLSAARLGVYLHGKAGDKAADSRSEAALIAGDIISFL